MAQSRAPVYVVDVGWYHDSTAVAWAWREPHRAEEPGRIVLQVKVWTTEQDQLGEFVSGGRMELPLVEGFIQSLAQGYKVKEVAYDPNYFGRSAELIERAGFVAVKMLPASGPTQEAWSTFYQLAKERRLAHDGDSVLSAHVEAAAVFPTERGPRIRRLKSTSRIDALSAAVLAVARCEVHQHETQPMSPNIYWMTIDGEDFVV